MESRNLTAFLVRCQGVVNRVCRASGRPPSHLEVVELQKAVHEAQGAAQGSNLSEQQVMLTWEVTLDIWVCVQARLVEAQQWSTTKWGLLLQNYHTEQSAVSEPAIKNVTAQLLQCAWYDRPRQRLV